MNGQVIKKNKIILKDLHEHINVFMESFGGYSLISRWFNFTLIGITTHTRPPQSITKAVLYWSFSAMEI
jgi:hypothetical protein